MTFQSCVKGQYIVSEFFYLFILLLFMQGINNRKSSLCGSFFSNGMYCFIVCTNVFLINLFFLADLFCSVFTTVFLICF